VPIRAPAGARTLTALFTNLSAVTRTVFNASTGWIVEKTRWFRFFLIYAAAWVLLRNEHAFKAVADSCRLTLATFVPTVVLVGLPAVLMYPLSFLDSRGDLFVTKFRPEAVTGLMLVQIVLELLFGFLLVGATTRIFIYQTEEAA